MLQLSQVSLRRGARILFESASFQIGPGWKVGVTGANGSGKSSLLALIRDEMASDQGDVTRPPDWMIAHVAQELTALERPALDFVIDGDGELRQVEAALADAEHAGDGRRQGELFARYESIGGYTATSRAARLLHGLGFAEAQLSLPVSAFSGGWRMRLNLARALMCRSDLLLLDEPTNHLDLDAVIWLQDWLAQYPGTLLLISHDRDFLDDLTDHILHIEQGRITLYTGNYSTFEQTRAERLAQQQSAFDRQQREIAHMQSYVDRFRAKATKARQAQSRLKALERMARIAPAHVDSPFSFRFPEPPAAGNPLLQLRDVEFGYTSTPVLQQVQLELAGGDRIGLLGRNGAGKSTLVKLLAGELTPRCGERPAAKNLRIGYFSQHALEQLDADGTPLGHLQKQAPRSREADLRAYLGGFDFGGERALTPVRILSGGEKSRLVLALIIHQAPNLLLLDEPTNHLDLDMRQALTAALQEYSGAMVVVSHDRYLLRAVCDRLLLVHEGSAGEFDGDLDDYRHWLGQPSAGAATSKETIKPVSRQTQRQDSAERRRQLQPLRRALERCEQRLAQLQQSKQHIQTELAREALYQDANKAELTALLQKSGDLDRALGEAEAAWLEAAQVLENAQLL